MGETLGQLLPLALAIAIFPVPIVTVVLVLGSERGRLKGIAFVVSWLAGLAVVGVLVLALAGAADASDDDGGQATWASLLLLALGLACIAAGIKQWRGRPRDDAEPPAPGWMTTIDGLGPSRVAGIGFALAGINPKNVLLVAGAAAEIAAAGLSAADEAVVLAAFVLLASLGVLGPLVAALVLGERSRAPLESVRRTMARHNAVVMAVLLLVIGAKLVGDAISGLAG